jgi:beta-glucanase (GH16 family)
MRPFASRHLLGGSAPVLNPILDQIPGASAAYGLRRLRLAYSGSAIRVRRGNDNAEQDIGFTSAGDLDTSALATFVGANSGFVTTWYDQSGNSNHATQATAVNQPRIVNAGALEKQNNKPAINWYTGGTLFLIAPISGVSTAYTSLMVATSGATGNTFGRLLTLYKAGDASDSGVTTSMQVLSKFGSGNVLAAFGNNASVSQSNDNVAAGTQFQATTLLASSTTCSLYVHGRLYNTNILTSLALAPTQLNFGGHVAGASSFVGYWSEAIFYTSALSAASQKTVELNQANYYGLIVAGKNTLDDSFSGSSLDGAKWTPQYWFGNTNAGNNELEWYQSGNITVGSGTAKLQAKSEVVVHNSITYNYTSGLISSHDKFYQTYGHFEARVKIPAGKGLWPAFWLMPQDHSWPPELDIMEILGQAPSTVYLTNHYGTSGSPQQTSNTYVGADYSAGFHTFAMVWTPAFIKWFIDGTERASQSSNIPNKDMFVILNLAVGGTFPGSPDGTTTFPATYEIDYVRAWSIA